MKTRKILAILVLVGLLVWPVEVSEAAEMGTAFTYQGRLIDANDAAEGVYDFNFGLYDSAGDGNQVGSDVNIADEDVIDALFTVELDFGSSVFDGEARWLEIGVRPGEQNDPNAYTTLAPRQKITPTPYAVYAAEAAAVPGGTTNYIPKFIQGNKLGNSVIYESNGNIGIGTTSPGVKLQVGDTDVGHDVYIAGSTNSQSGLFFYDGAIPGGMRYNFNTDDLSIFTAGTTRLMIDSSGNVGIGTTGPDEELHVVGSVKIVDGTEGANKVLTSDANGVANWQEPQLPPGSGVPSGVIVMWSGSIASIPSGWALCDGDNNTPDLRDRFIVGASQDDGGVAKTNITGSLTQTGGSIQHDHGGATEGHTLTVTQMPSHRHRLKGGSDLKTNVSGFGHWDSFGVGSPLGYQGVSWYDSDAQANQLVENTGSSQAHSHGISSTNHLPPYYALAYIMKLP